MKTALRINTDLTTEVLDLDTDSYEKLSGAVGGMIQAVDVADDLTLWCNEEGKLIGLQPNIIGTSLWEQRFGATDIIAGNIVLTGGPDDEGDSLPLSAAWLENLQGMTGRLRAALEGNIGVM
jgi:hypothetical protein